jgi:hypothetical protein
MMYTIYKDNTTGWIETYAAVAECDSYTDAVAKAKQLLGAEEVDLIHGETYYGIGVVEGNSNNSNNNVTIVRAGSRELYIEGKEDSTMIDMKYYDAAVQLMDDDLREEIAAEGNCETEEQFLREYERRHYEKYGEEFTV